jgi:hypothetical protein
LKIFWIWKFEFAIFRACFQPLDFFILSYPFRVKYVRSWKKWRIRIRYE